MLAKRLFCCAFVLCMTSLCTASKKDVVLHYVVGMARSVKRYKKVSQCASWSRQRSSNSSQPSGSPHAQNFFWGGKLFYIVLLKLMRNCTMVLLIFSWYLVASSGIVVSRALLLDSMTFVKNSLCSLALFVQICKVGTILMDCSCASVKRYSCISLFSVSCST